ncbi:hypothetical protein C0J52_19512 [Blattella germanica]|nr:hypothetical protein C0J52_19512 [Blattella germanica]
MPLQNIRQLMNVWLSLKVGFLINNISPKSPIKRGYKIWLRADKLGYVCDFQVYTGKTNNKVEVNLGQRVVLELCEGLENKGYNILFDNYFKSVSLEDNLNQRGLPSCGTVRSDRKGLPQLKQDRDLSRGECDYAVRSDGIACVKWKDKRCVMFLSTIESPQEMSTVNRKESDGSITQIQCPSIAKTYHANMGCVDKADMLRSLYTIDRKTKRTWLRLFWYFVDVSIVNSCILYSLSNTGRSLKL